MLPPRRHAPQSYHLIMAQLTQARLEKRQLADLLEAARADAVAKYLATFQQELNEISQENARLRAQLSTPADHDQRTQRHSARSPLRLKTSVKSSYVDQNQHASAKKQRSCVSPNIVRVKKDLKLTESTNNLARSQVSSPHNHNKRKSQLTERKVEDHKVMRTEISFSLLDDREDFLKDALSVRDLRAPEHQQQNIFLQILEDILEDEKQHQENAHAEIIGLPPQDHARHIEPEVHFINELEAEISQAAQKIEKLSLIVGKYESEMKQLNISIRDTEDWTRKLWEVKGKYIQMQKKCATLAPLRKEVAQKKERLRVLKQEKGQAHTLGSVEELIRVFGRPCRTFQQRGRGYRSYYQSVQGLFEAGKGGEWTCGRAARVRETLDCIREGRRKLSELIAVYESRIGRLEEKVRLCGFH